MDNAQGHAGRAHAFTVVSFGLLCAERQVPLGDIPLGQDQRPARRVGRRAGLPAGSGLLLVVSLLLFLGIFGAYVAFKRKNPAITFALVIGMTILYISAAFSRLLVYSSISFVILAGIGFAELAFSLMKPSRIDGQAETGLHEGNEMRAVYRWPYSPHRLPGEHILDTQPGPVHGQHLHLRPEPGRLRRHHRQRRHDLRPLEPDRLDPGPVLDQNQHPRTP